MEEKLEIKVPVKLLKRMDTIRELLGYKSRGEFMLVAVRRLLDQYAILTSELRNTRE